MQNVFCIEWFTKNWYFIFHCDKSPQMLLCIFFFCSTDDIFLVNVITCNMSTAPFFLVWAVINSVAWGYGTTRALPWTTVVLLMALWVFGKFMLMSEFVLFICTCMTLKYLENIQMLLYYIEVCSWVIQLT